MGYDLALDNIGRSVEYSEGAAASGHSSPPAKKTAAQWLPLWQSVSRSSLINLLYTDSLIAAALEHLDLQEGDSVLDLGCGAGTKTDAFRKLGMHSVGIDLDPEVINEATDNFPETSFQIGDVHQLPFPDNTFDAVFSLSVLQYVDRKKVLSECCRVLKPTGKAAFVEHLNRNPFVRLYRAARRVCGWEYAPFLTPRGYIDWDDHVEFDEVFPEPILTARHLTSPVALVLPAIRRHFGGKDLTLDSSGVLRLLQQLDGFLLRRARSLSRYCWFVLVTVTK